MTFTTMFDAAPARRRGAACPARRDGCRRLQLFHGTRGSAMKRAMGFAALVCVAVAACSAVNPGSGSKPGSGGGTVTPAP
ncbi:hypothetical protein, partial [Xanthomonas sacchari]|uniref:hypothetical protein n=1 Tax=Xanthomonas sacchari TaxID=56458 RepID=UPI002253EF82